MDNSWYSNYVNKLENGSYKFVEITKENLNDITIDNIAFYSFAEGGACGEHGGVEIVLKNKKFYHTNHVERDEIFKQLILKLKPLDDVWFCVCWGENIPEGFKFYNLGLGNYLIVRNEYVEQFEEFFKGKPPAQKYTLWKDFALSVL